MRVGVGRRESRTVPAPEREQKADQTQMLTQRAPAQASSGLLEASSHLAPPALPLLPEESHTPPAG